MPTAEPDRPPTEDGTAPVDLGSDQPELSRLGLDDDMLRLYRAALRTGATASGELAALSGLDLDRTERGLARLAADGFLTAFGAVAPRAALRTVVTRRMAELAEQEAELRTVDAMVDGLADGQARVGGPQPVGDASLVVGTPEIARLTTHLVMSARHEVLVLDTPPYVQIGTGRSDASSAHFSVGADDDVDQALARGVVSRRIVSQDGLDTPGRAEGILELGGAGMTVRVRATLPTKLLVVDRETALLPPSSSADAATTALVLRGGVLAHVLVPLFEALWEDAVPVVAPPGDAPHPDGALTTEERELLTMLAAGLKDEAVARQLDVHVATARRRITALLARLGASSRFQAGVQAARRGWLADS